MKGVSGKILRINLTSGAVATGEPPESLYRAYLGGAGFVSYYLLKEIPKGIDPFSPENRLIFAAGPMTGLGISGASRVCIGSKSPLTQGYAKSEVGGSWPMDFKRTGYDALIIEGRSEKPVYLNILSNGQVEIRDASHLWGKTCLETHDAIVAELGDDLVHTSAIGPAGEKLVRFACIVNDLKDVAGRGGMGAVMGSKNLKAIAVRRGRPPEVADAAKIREMARNMSQRPHPMTGIGTGRFMEDMNEDGIVPTNNFQRRYFLGTRSISPRAIAETIRVDMDGCAACHVRCKKVVEFDTPLRVDRRNGGPEYETLAALGSCCGVDDVKAIGKASELCNLYSLDTISAGVTIAFAMECYEREILSSVDTDGIELRFGNAEAMLQVLEMIARRQGMGDLLAEGSWRAAQRIGAADFAMHVKGVEIPMHEPRAKQALGLTYAIAAHGADHMVGPHTLGPVAETKVEFRQRHLLALFRDSLVCCLFVPWSVDEQVAIVQAATGWDYSADEAMRVGDRVAQLARLFNLREGLTSADDNLPRRFFGRTTAGGSEETTIECSDFEQAIRDIYREMGWNMDGIPERKKLIDLGLEWALDALS